MSASIVEIADAIVAGLNADRLGGSMTVEAVRAYALATDLAEMDELHVTVVPRGEEVAAGSRGQQQVDCQIDVAFQKAVTGEADVDALLLLVQEAGDWLWGRRLGPPGQTGEAVCIRTANEPLIEIDHLPELGQFTSVLRATCRTYR